MKEKVKTWVGVILIFALLGFVGCCLAWSGEIFRAADVPIYKKFCVAVFETVVIYIVILFLHGEERDRENRKRHLIANIWFDWDSPVAKICREYGGDGYWAVDDFVERAATKAAWDELERRKKKRENSASSPSSADDMTA